VDVTPDKTRSVQRKQVDDCLEKRNPFPLIIVKENRLKIKKGKIHFVIP